jgi:hypothetical protein
MTSKEFIVWMKGFVEACNEFAPTPKQWDKIKEVLEEVDDNKKSSSFNYTTTVWNDQMGCWHYTNYPEGFGYYTNSTAEGKKELLND